MIDEHMFCTTEIFNTLNIFLYTIIVKAARLVPNTLTVAPFDSTSTNLFRRLLRLKVDFLTFSIKDETRMPYLLQYVRSTSFDVLCDCLVPQNLLDTNYNALVTILKSFYDSPLLELVKNFKFYHKKQKKGKSIQEFLTALQKFSIHCRFKEYLKTALKNQSVFRL